MFTIRFTMTGDLTRNTVSILTMNVSVRIFTGTAITGYTTMADRGKEDNFSFNQIEMAYYVDHYSDYVINQNKRHEKARHPDRCKGVEDVLKNKKTCPEESIYQLGTIDEHASVETLVLVFDEFKKEFDERFGSNVHIIDWSLHMDEATPHIHERHVFDATNRYGRLNRNRKRHWKNLALNFRIRKRKDQRQITVRLFLILPAGQCSWISVNVMDWKLTKNRPMEEGSIWRNRTISE